MTKLLTFAVLALALCLAAATPVPENSSKLDKAAVDQLDTMHDSVTEKREIEFENVEKVDKVVEKAEKKKLDERRSTIDEFEQPLNVTQWGENPCEATRNFNYYVSFPNDTTRYIQCNPWGTGVVRRCLQGTVWNMWALNCDLAENIASSHNMTILVAPQRVFNCSMSGRECQNGGVCTESSLGGDRCVCRPEFTGQSCESRLDVTDLTHAILNGTFDIHEFRERLAELNISASADVYSRYRDQLDNVTFRALMAYMSLYNGTEIRYDTVVNNLVEAILENIYPDAAYLSSFNASAVSVVDLIQLIPNLMSYSKYSIERYSDVFAKYQQVLGRLVTYLNGTESSHPRLRLEAAAYSRLTGIFMNQTLVMANNNNNNQTMTSTNTFANTENVNSLLEPHTEASRQQQSEAQIRESLRVQFNATLNATQCLFKAIEVFEREVSKLVEGGNKDVYAMNIASAKLNGTAEISEMLGQISASSVQIWDALVNYGFWYITSLLTAPVKVVLEQSAAALKQQVA